MTEATRAGRLASLTQADADSGVLTRFAAVLDALADEPAVVDDEGTSTYAQVADEAAAVRAAVVARTTSDVPVGVVFAHRRQAVAAVLGVLASGRPLVVLDHRTPAPRLAQLCERVDVGLVVAGAGQGDTAREIGRPVLDATTLPPAARETLWDSRVDPSAPAVLAFTSGSTGRPKVVVNSGAMLVSDAWRNSAATGCYDADDVIAHTLPMAFHAGLMVTCAGLLVGSTMRLYDTREHGIAGLAPWIGQVGATVMHTSPAILRAFVGSGATADRLTSLRTVTIAGEPAQGRDVERLRPLIPAGCVLRNRYGSSETGLIAEYVVDHDHPRLEGPLPVGAPVGDTEITCLTDDGVPLPGGTPGVVAVTRDHVASGYLGDPDATAAAFSTGPDGRRTYRTSDVGRMDAGRLTLLGRRDHSVKVRGYLVEPSEVDAALFALPDVAEALTVGVRDEATDRYRLVAYVVPAAERVSGARIRADLRDRLPGHLVPESVVFLDALPRTERGKLDRSALPPAPPVDAGPMPVSEWERLVAQVWCRVLGLEAVGLDADFFALGGDSLAAEELTAAVVSDLGIDAADVTSATLVQAPTLRDYAKRLKRRPDRAHQILTVLREDGDRPPLFLVAGGGALGIGFVPMVRHLPPGRPIYAFHSYGIEVKALPDWSIRSAARRNVREMRRIQAHGPYHLAGHSYGGLVALEMAQQLRAAGEEVAILVELDSFPPQPDIIPPLRREPVTFARRLRDLAGLLVTGLVPHPGHGQFWRFHAQSHALTMRYRTTPYPGRTAVVVADSEDKEVRAAWGPHLTGEWRTLTTPGDHVAMLREPYAETTAAALATALAWADGAGFDGVDLQDRPVDSVA